MSRRPRGLVVVLALTAVCAMAVQTSDARALIKHTKKVSKRYDLAGPSFFVDRETDPTCGTPAKCQLKAAFPSDGAYDIGGVTIPKAGGTGTRKATAKVTAKDDVDLAGTGWVWVSVCQDLDNDDTCGEDANDPSDTTPNKYPEPSNFGCVSSKTGITLASVVRTKPVLVFVAAATGCPKYLLDTDDNSSATSGLISVTYTWYT